MAQDTDSLTTDTSEPAARVAIWGLMIALDCRRLDATPVRFALDEVDRVEIGRGEQRRAHRDRSVLRIELDDTGMSQVHLRLELEGGAWVAIDAKSKNGTRVNGRRFQRGILRDGDVIECGNTFIVMRRDVPASGAPSLPTLAQTLSPALERELALLMKIAPSSVPVLVRGETGTGKEVVAASLHEHSKRLGALVSVNCAAIPPTLLESELFGSRRGAFSGAEDRSGLVQNANRGTLFLDEVTELPAASQAALLRVLEEGEVLPLGAGKSIAVDVRIIAATNRSIEELMADGRFRRDLYARLRGYEVRLPTLRERIEDLGILISALIARHRPDDSPRTLTRAAARSLFLHRWQFNVRELEQALRTAIAITPAAELAPAALRLDAVAPAAGTTRRERLLALIEEHRGNLSAVARALATSRSQLHRALARESIDPASLKR